MGLRRRASTSRIAGGLRLSLALHTLAIVRVCSKRARVEALTEIVCLGSTPTDHELETIIAAAHALNLSVKLRPVVQADFPFTGIEGCTLATGGMQCPSQTGVGAGMSPADFQAFFWGADGTVAKPAEGSYAYFVYHVAALAERTHAEIVSVSVEMSSANPQEGHFRRLIGGVRKIFSGQLHCDVASGKHAPGFGCKTRSEAPKSSPSTGPHSASQFHRGDHGGALLGRSGRRWRGRVPRAHGGHRRDRGESERGRACRGVRPGAQADVGLLPWAWPATAAADAARAALPAR